MNYLHNLLIQSADRKSGTPNDFTIDIPPLHGLKRWKLISAKVPNTFYNINQSNYLIHWTRSGASHSAALAPGSYNIQEFINALAASMNVEDTGATYNVLFSTITLKIKIQCSQNIILKTTNTTTAMWNVLGFETGVDTISSGELEATKVVRLDNPNYVFISIREFYTQNSACSSGLKASAVIDLRNNSTAVESWNIDNSYDIAECYTASNSISELSVKMMFPDGAEANLNGADWSFMLSLNYC